MTTTSRYGVMAAKELRQAWPIFAVYGALPVLTLVNVLSESVSAGTLPVNDARSAAWTPSHTLLMSFLFVWGGIRLFHVEQKEGTRVWLRTFPFSDAGVAAIKLGVGFLAVLVSFLASGLIGDIFAGSMVPGLRVASIEALSAGCWLLVGGLASLTILRRRAAMPFVFLWLAGSVAFVMLLVAYRGLDASPLEIPLLPALSAHVAAAAVLGLWVTRLYARGEVV